MNRTQKIGTTILGVMMAAGLAACGSAPQQTQTAEPTVSHGYSQFTGYVVEDAPMGGFGITSLGDIESYMNRK